MRHPGCTHDVLLRNTNCFLKQRDDPPNAGGVSIIVEGAVLSRCRNGASSRKGCVVDGQITKATNMCTRPAPPPSRTPFAVSGSAYTGN